VISAPLGFRQLVVEEDPVSWELGGVDEAPVHLGSLDGLLRFPEGALPLSC
jgi:hypothetical protein